MRPLDQAHWRLAAALWSTLMACTPSPPNPNPAPVARAVPPTDAAPAAPNALWQARARAATLTAGLDFDAALKALDEGMADAGAATDTDLAVVRCERAAVLSRRAAATVDLRGRERDLRAALLDCPGEVALQQGLADTLVRQARALDDESARIALLRESVAVYEGVVALVDLALVLEKHNEPAAAAAAADRAATLAVDQPGLAALRERLQKAANVEGSFKSARHSHFVARFEGYGEERLAWGALDTLEQAWFAVGKALDLYPQAPITVVIYTGEQYRSATAAPDWSTGLFDGKIRIREALLAADRGTLDDTLVHEYLHAALHTLPVTVPSWFHEGLAQHFESQRPSPGLVLARTGVAPRAHLDVPFTQLPPSVVGAAYATAHAVVERMVERRGAWGLNQLIGELKGGRDFDDSVRRTFAVDVDALYRDVAGR